MVYYGYYELWPVFYPMTVELLCVIYLTFLKIYFERCTAGKKNGLAAREGEARDLWHLSESSSLIDVIPTQLETSL